MRSVKVKVKAQDRNGKEFEKELEDMAARAACHEIDHLDGILFIDKAERVFTDEELEEMFEEQAQEEEEAEKKEKKRKS
jgi:peptide deformylase